MFSSTFPALNLYFFIVGMSYELKLTRWIIIVIIIITIIIIIIIIIIINNNNNNNNQFNYSFCSLRTKLQEWSGY